MSEATTWTGLRTALPAARDREASWGRAPQPGLAWGIISDPMWCAHHALARAGTSIRARISLETFNVFGGVFKCRDFLAKLLQRK